MIAVLGAGAFGTALAIALAQGGRDVVLWGRNPQARFTGRENALLPGVALPDKVRLTHDLTQIAPATTVLIALPAQALAGFASGAEDLLRGKALIACCKGIDLTQHIGPVEILRRAVPEATHGILTGPSFARDIARGLPTALTLAGADRRLQEQLSTPALRLYLTQDTAGAELGGALKNVIAIACGATMGAGLGDSARASVMTRGFAEMQRLAPVFGAQPETLAGLSGLGDLTLTCTSDGSRNYRHGFALGAGAMPDPGQTVEGVATAQALTEIAAERALDLPICRAVAMLTRGDQSLPEILSALLARPLREE